MFDLNSSFFLSNLQLKIHTVHHTPNCSRLLLHSNEKCGKQFRSYRNGHTTTTDCDLFADGRRSSSSALALHTQTHTHTIIWTGKNGLFLFFFLSFFLFALLVEILNESKCKCCWTTYIESRVLCATKCITWEALARMILVSFYSVVPCIQWACTVCALLCISVWIYLPSKSSSRRRVPIHTFIQHTSVRSMSSMREWFCWNDEQLLLWVEYTYMRNIRLRPTIPGFRYIE